VHYHMCSYLIALASPLPRKIATNNYSRRILRDFLRFWSCLSLRLAATRPKIFLFLVSNCSLAHAPPPPPVIHVSMRNQRLLHWRALEHQQLYLAFYRSSSSFRFWKRKTYQLSENLNSTSAPPSLQSLSIFFIMYAIHIDEGVTEAPMSRLSRFTGRGLYDVGGMFSFGVGLRGPINVATYCEGSLYGNTAPANLSWER